MYLSLGPLYLKGEIALPPVSTAILLSVYGQIQKLDYSAVLEAHSQKFCFNILWDLTLIRSIPGTLWRP